MNQPDRESAVCDTSPTAVPTVRAMLVGAPKAGTTSLYRYAVQHPALIGHDQREMTCFFSDEEYSLGLSACLAKYLPDGVPANKTFLAKHVFTMYREQAIARLKALNPEAHLFVLLRDPIRRAYSSYWYSRRRGWDPAVSFDAAVQWEMDQPATDEDWLQQRDRRHLRVGEYEPCIRRLFDAFGQNRVHVMLTEDLAQDAAGCCRTIYQTLGIDPDFVPDLTRTHNPAAAARSQAVARTVAGALKHKGKVKRTIRRFIPHTIARRARHTLLRMNEKPFTPPPMPDETRHRLIEYFKPHNQALSELIGRDLSAWSEA